MSDEFVNALQNGKNLEAEDVSKLRCKIRLDALETKKRSCK